MTAPFMRAYTELLVRTCHRRGAHAIGGMAAFIPSRRDPEVNEAAMARVRDDKERESGDGFDGTWVAHPDLVPLATEIFDGVLGDRAEPEGAAARRAEVEVDGRAAARLRASRAARSPRPASGSNVSVALQYLDSWLRRQRRRGDQQPDGGRRDGRDLPLAALAVADRRHAARRRPVVRPAGSTRRSATRSWRALGGSGAATAASREAARSSTSSSSTTTSPSS